MCVSYLWGRESRFAGKPVFRLAKVSTRARETAYRRQKGAWEAADIAVLKSTTAHARARSQS